MAGSESSACCSVRQMDPALTALHVSLAEDLSPLFCLDLVQGGSGSTCSDAQMSAWSMVTSL